MSTQVFPLVFSHADQAHQLHLIRSCLDSPVTGQLDYSEGQPILVSGWLYSLKPELRGLSVHCSADDGPWQVTNAVHRPDVEKQFIAFGGQLGDEPTQFGFQIRVSAKYHIILAAHLDGKWMGLHSIAMNAEGYADLYESSLRQFVSNGQPVPSALMAPLDRSPLEAHIARWANRIKVNSEHNVLEGIDPLPLDLAEPIERFRLYVRTHQNLVDLVKDADGPVMLHPLRKTECKAFGGGVFDWHSYFVRFSDGLDSVYVLQKVSAIDAVFIPSRNFLFKFQHSDGMNLNKLLTSIVRGLLHQAAHKYPSRFLGFNVGHERPAHLMQDVLPGVAYLDEQRLLHPEIKWCTQNGGDYIDLSACFANTSKATNYPQQLEPGQFTCQMGAPMVYHSPGRFDAGFYDRIFQRLVNMASAVESDSFALHLLSGKQSFVLWLGVSSQKRIWLNQVEGLIKVIEMFQLNFPNLLVAFDGWTTPITPLPTDIVEIRRDSEVVQKVLGALAVKPAHINLVGARVSQKIAVAKYTSFYLTSALTGSIWVSRALKNKGLLHISNPLREIAEHHLGNPNAILLDSNFIKEVDAEKAPRFDCINYEINTEGLLNTIKFCTPEFKWNS